MVFNLNVRNWESYNILVSVKDNSEVVSSSEKESRASDLHATLAMLC